MMGPFLKIHCMLLPLNHLSAMKLFLTFSCHFHVHKFNLVKCIKKSLWNTWSPAFFAIFIKVKFPDLLLWSVAFFYWNFLSGLPLAHVETQTNVIMLQLSTWAQCPLLVRVLRVASCHSDLHLKLYIYMSKFLRYLNFLLLTNKMLLINGVCDAAISSLCPNSIKSICSCFEDVVRWEL